MSGAPGSHTGPLRTPHARRPLRARLLLLLTGTLGCVCAGLVLTTVLAQRACLMGELDGRVSDAAEHGLTGAARRTERPADLSFLRGGGHTPGLLAARFDSGGRILSAAVVGRDDGPRPLGPAQRAALAGVPHDGQAHTRTVPGLGAYRVTALDASGIRILAGLPLAGVRHTLGRLVRIEVTATAAALALAGTACALVVRRQLGPLGRVAAGAAQVARAPLGADRPTGLARLPAPEADPGTEAGQIAAALNHMIDQVEDSHAERRRSEERLRRFIADAAHELRTPLASIAGYAELMGRIAPDAVWHRITAESARMTGLVEDLLLLARLDAGRPLRAAEVDLAAVVAEAVADTRTLGADHVWRLRLPVGSPALTVGDHPHLKQAVTALLVNACVHTPPGTTVTVALETTAGRHTVRVRDDGPGIPHHLLPAVFDPFTRADPSRTRTGLGEGGSRLGLAVAAAITGAHRGRIDVHSAPGRTEFRIELPVAGPSPGTPAAPYGSACSAQITLP